MAFSGNIKYSGTFEDLPKNSWKIAMHLQGYGGSETALFVGSAGVKLSHTGDNYNKEQGIFPGTLQFSLVAESNFQLTEILYADDREWKVQLSQSSTVYFSGDLISTVVTEPYVDGSLPNEISFTAIDGLTDLKNEKYLNSGALYNEFQKPIDIIRKCLENLNEVTTVYENVDIKATTGMNATDTHSPLNQSFIHTSAYGITPDSTITKWQVLTNAMQAFRCRFFSNRPEAPGWIMQKIDLLTETSDVFRINNSVSDNAFSTAVITQLLTGGTDFRQRGPGSIMISQAPSEINITTDRGLFPTLLLGDNFESTDFDGGGELINWGASTGIFSHYQGVMVKSTDYREDTAPTGETVLEVDGLGGTVFSYSGAATAGAGARTNFTGIPTGGTTSISVGDRVVFYDSETGDYEGVAVVFGKTGTTLDMQITFVATTSGVFYLIEPTKTLDQRVVYGGEVDELKDNDILRITIRVRENLITDVERILPIGVYANLGTGSTDDTFRKTQDGNNAWWNSDLTQNAQSVEDQVILIRGLTQEFKEYTIDVDLSNLSSSATSAEIYLAIMQPFPRIGNIQIDSINIINISQAEETTTTTTIKANNVFPKDITFFHTDGDTTDNEEYIYNHPIFDDASPKKIINSWQQAGATADNLQDIFGANLALAYAKNSQIWNINLLGVASSVSMVNSLKDPLNFDRIFQIQNITRDFVLDETAVNAVEVIGQGNYWANGADEDDWANDWTDTAAGGQAPWGSDGAVTLTWTSGGAVNSFRFDHGFLAHVGNKFRLELDFTITLNVGTVSSYGFLLVFGSLSSSVQENISAPGSFSIDQEITVAGSSPFQIFIQWQNFVGSVNPTIVTCQLDKVKLTFNSYG